MGGVIATVPSVSRQLCSRLVSLAHGDDGWFQPLHIGLGERAMRVGDSELYSVVRQAVAWDRQHVDALQASFLLYHVLHESAQALGDERVLPSVGRALHADYLSLSDCERGKFAASGLHALRGGSCLPLDGLLEGFLATKHADLRVAGRQYAGLTYALLSEAGMPNGGSLARFRNHPDC